MARAGRTCSSAPTSGRPSRGRGSSSSSSSGGLGHASNGRPVQWLAESIEPAPAPPASPSEGPICCWMSERAGEPLVARNSILGQGKVVRRLEESFPESLQKPQQNIGTTTRGPQGRIPLWRAARWGCGAAARRWLEAANLPSHATSDPGL